MSDTEAGGGFGGARPGDEHALMQPMVGAFRAEVSLFMGPGEPVVMRGSMRNEWDLGGLFLKQTYTGDPAADGQPGFDGRGYWGFNQTTGEYEGFWIDIATSMFQLERGSVDASGRVWTMIGQLPHPQGGTLRKKSVITVESPDRHRIEQFLTPEGGEEFRSMQIVFTRSR